VAHLKKAKLEVVIEAGAGTAAGFPDSAYRHAGAALSDSRDTVFGGRNFKTSEFANPHRGDCHRATAQRR